MEQRTTATAQRRDVITYNTFKSVLVTFIVASATVAASAACAAAATALPTPSCPSGQFAWPRGSHFCWYRRDSGGSPVGPGPNVFTPSNVALDSSGRLTLSVRREAHGLTCGEVFLNRSLGLGDYVFVTTTDPAALHPSLVASAFLYATDTQEFDVIEHSRWSWPSSANSQFVVQPWQTSPPHRFNLSGSLFTHRLRWAGTTSPSEVTFETYAGAGAEPGGLLASWTATGAARENARADQRAALPAASAAWPPAPDGVMCARGPLRPSAAGRRDTSAAAPPLQVATALSRAGSACTSTTGCSTAPE